MWAPIKLNSGQTHPYGFGWAVRSVNGRRVIEHGGAWQGFKAHIARYVDDNLTVIVFANLIQANQERLANGVAQIVVPDLKPKPIADPDPAFTAKTRELLVAVIESKADMSHFTLGVQNAMKQSDGRLVSFVKSQGPIQKFVLTERSETPNGVSYRYKVEFTGMSLFLAMAVNKEGKIAGFALQPE
jgi:hypothetical protein